MSGFEAEWKMRELELAAEMQRSMLPPAAPPVPGYSFWVTWEPARAVGGDMYDFHMLPTGGVVVLVADVAERG